MIKVWLKQRRVHADYNLSDCSHSAYLLLVHVLVDASIDSKALPPRKKHRLADEFEPGSEDVLWVFEHRLQLLGGNIASIADFVQVGLKVNICLDEENVIDCKQIHMLVSMVNHMQHR